MLYFIFVLFMGVFLAALAGPLARQFGWAYGRFGRYGDMAAVIIAALVGAVLLAVIFGAAGAEAGGGEGALIGGFVGALLGVLLLGLFSAVSAAAEPNRAGEADPSGPTPPGNQPPGPQQAVRGRRPDESESGALR